MKTTSWVRREEGKEEDKEKRKKNNRVKGESVLVWRLWNPATCGGCHLYTKKGGSAERKTNYLSGWGISWRNTKRVDMEGERGTNR